MSNFLYCNLPKNVLGKKNFSIVGIGDTLEVRLSELGKESSVEFWTKIKEIKCNRIELELKDSHDAYEPIQIFNFL